MHTADVVIGAGFGDEGKGLVTDFLAAKYGEEALVVRFNGGAQAGHTVQTPEGKRHVFSHFGSGSLAGARTYLSRFFVCNPFVFLRERPKLVALGVTPTVYIDENCPITTPYDMMINQIVEEARGSDRHGSCGLGFGETIERTANPRYALLVRDLIGRERLREQLVLIQRGWSAARLHALGVIEIPDEWQRRLFSDDILQGYLASIEEMLSFVTPTSSDILRQKGLVIFEGAQGLMLDQDRGWFPHVTRSNTGLTNAMKLAKKAGFEALNVTYMIRAYATRHGAGPLAHELSSMPYARIVDQTNIPNPYQGTLRFGWLDLDLLGNFINEDLHGKPHPIAVRHSLGISCMDQVEDTVSFIDGARLCTAAPEDFIQRALKAAQTQRGIVSYGPTRDDIQPVNVEPRPALRAERNMCFV